MLCHSHYRYRNIHTHSDAQEHQRGKNTFFVDQLMNHPPKTIAVALKNLTTRVLPPA